MTEQIVTALSWACLVAGGFFFLVSAIGLNRMPDLFSRIHAASVGDTLGIGLIVAGMLLQAGPTLVAVKLVIIVLILGITGPVAAHALARAALHDGLRPLLADDDGRLVPADLERDFPVLAERLAEPVNPVESADGGAWSSNR